MFHYIFMEEENRLDNTYSQNHSETMNGQTVVPHFNHGAHELMDVHEVLSAAIGALNLSTILRPHVKDQELLTILDRQYAFALDEYNMLVECFKTGKDPSHRTASYKMTTDNDFTYGMKPASQPKKPIQSASEITDEMISGYLLSSAKAGAAGKVPAALEATNPVVRRVLQDSIPNCIEMAYELSIYQNKHGYYQVPRFDEQTMEQILNTYGTAQGPMYKMQ